MTIEISSIRQGEHEFRYCAQMKRLPREATMQMLRLLEKWHRIVPREHNYAWRTFGAPALIARFDGVWDGRKFHTYEIQAGCGWVGFAGTANFAFKEIRDGMYGTLWPRYLLVTDNTNHDDLLWLRRISLSDALSGDAPLVLRFPINGITDEEREILFQKQVKPRRAGLHKKYGVLLGLWKPVDSEAHKRFLPWDQAFVLKPLNDNGSRDVMIWQPDTRAGRATRTQILATLERHGRMFLQPFHAPIKERIDDIDYNVICRPFFGFDTKRKQWTPMHGVWTGRPWPNTRIHGASDALSGPLILEM